MIFCSAYMQRTKRENDLEILGKPAGCTVDKTLISLTYRVGRLENLDS